MKEREIKIPVSNLAAVRGPLKEREIKIPVSDLATVRGRLLAVGAELHHPASLEANLVFDLVDAPAEQRLRSRRELLRLRSDGAGHRLTFKSAPRFVEGVKERLEHEFSVDDPAAARLLLESLGFGIAVRYEKVRETWLLLGCEVALDRTPMGDFVEVEELRVEVEEEAGGPPTNPGGPPTNPGGPPTNRIAEVCRQCGLDAGRSVPEDYLALYRAYREDRPDLPRDMVFGPDPHPGRGTEA